jgi:hypothetical protein
MTPTAFDELPADLVAELAASGLDPRAIYQHVLAAFEEDLPGDAPDATTVAAILPSSWGWPTSRRATTAWWRRCHGVPRRDGRCGHRQWPAG